MVATPSPDWHPFIMLKSGTCACLLALLALSPSCRKQAGPDATGTRPPAMAPQLGSNQMKDAPPGLLSSRADSPVHWQHWQPEALQRAGDAHRLVFAFIGAAQYPGCVEALDAIDRDAALVNRLNTEFLPVLVDVDFCREGSLIAGALSQELKLPVSFPFILVLSPQGNEVTWRPVAYAPGGNLRELFEGAADVVAKMWAESPDYVAKNSAADHELRFSRLPKPDLIPATPAERDALLARAIRQLASLYDTDTGTLSGSGGLLPLGVLQCMASASLDPDTPPDIATRCREAVKAFGTTILYSAMVDPLDGGVYTTRFGNSWDLPVIHRTCLTQARAARALITLYRATGDARSLEVALAAVRFAEEQYGAQNGLFSFQRQPGSLNAADWMWTVEQIDQALTEPEAKLWKNLCKISPMGNLPLEADPTREFFRLNSLGFRTTPDAAATDVAINGEEAAQLLDSGRKKLLKARQARVSERAANPAASASASFRMVSAYAAIFTATGEATWRDKAISLALLSRQTFSRGALLAEQNPALPEDICDARAFTYALAIQAALDLAEITLDDNWRIWAGDLATTVAENFVDDEGRLMEVRPASTPFKMPLEDRMMHLDDSTAGLMRMNLARLEALGQSPPPTIAPWIRSLPPIAAYPLFFTDSILAASFARSRVIVDLPEKASPEWRDAASRLPLDRIARRLTKAPEVKLRGPDGSEATITDPAEMTRSMSSGTP